MLELQLRTPDTKSIVLILEGIVTNGVEFAMTGHISPDLFVYLN